MRCTAAETSAATAVTIRTHMVSSVPHDGDLDGPPRHDGPSPLDTGAAARRFTDRVHPGAST